MKRRRFFMLAALGCSLLGCAMPQAQNTGPGMIVTFTSLIGGRSIDIKNARLPSGKAFNGVGLSLGALPGKTNWRSTGATEGAVPDARELPEWVEFQWQEWPYPYPDEPSEPHARKAWGDRIHELSRTLPLHTARVLVRSRVPQDAVDEVMEAKRRRKPHELPDKMLYVYFIWTKSGIKFRWEMGRGGKTFREGGDRIGEES